MAEQQRLMTIQQQQQQQYLMTQQAMMQQTVVQQYQPPPQPQVQQVTTETRVQKFPIPRLVITAVRARSLRVWFRILLIAQTLGEDRDTG